MLNYFLTPEELDNPKAWFSKANQYRATVLFILKEYNLRCVDGAKIDDVAALLESISTIPYITCLALELFMKGFLVFYGEPGKEVRKYKHRIWQVRDSCYKKSKNPIFNNPDLTYITDKLGPHIMDDGGVRYPHKRDSAIPLDGCEIALKLMSKLAKELS